jgi:hypothetical protein
MFLSEGVELSFQSLDLRKGEMSLYGILDHDRPTPASSRADRRGVGFAASAGLAWLMIGRS